MIRDWVQYADGNKKGTIVGIKCDPRYLEQEARLTLMDYNGKWHEKELDDIKPIPITPEILEKNGFKYTHEHTLKGADTYILRHEQRGFDYTITLKLNDYFAVDSLDDRMYRIFETHICHRWCVHQLQHALRLCGIDKQIEL